MKENWVVLPQNDELAQSLAQSLKVHQIVAQLLVNRTITTPEEGLNFLDPKLKNLHDPFLFHDMGKCVDRILVACKDNQKVVFYGDYDVDGITGSALLSSLFSEIGIQNDCYIPHRINEGYGLSKEGITRCHQMGAKLIITVDCGIHAFEEIAFAKSLGMDVIVTDHHEPAETIPECIGVINQKVNDSGYPFRDLAGVGVAFKLAHGILKKGREDNLPWAFSIDLKTYLDYVPLGTVADIVPLIDENRILAKNGFMQLDKSKRPGIQALKSKVGISEGISSFDVAFKLAPRLNATGRIGDAYDSLLLMKTDNPSEAEYLANNLEYNNRARQRIEEETFKEALSEVEKTLDSEKERVLVVHKDNWPIGVIGIVASKLSRKFYRPVFVISSDDEGCKGSGRSIEGFDLSVALKKCSDILDSFGGHAFAAGIVLTKENISTFKMRMNLQADEVLTEKHLAKKVVIDSRLSLRDVTESLLSQINLLQPYGQNNPEPLFIIKGVQCDSVPVLIKEKHVKFLARNGGSFLEVIGFNMADRFAEIKKDLIFDIVTQLSVNTYKGRRTLQLMLKDFELVR